MKKLFIASLLVVCMVMGMIFQALAADPVLMESISLNEENIILFVGKTKGIKATAAPKNVTNKKVTWSSSDESVVTVNASGQVKGIGVGTATITATAQDESGVQASCEVTVVIPVKKIVADQSKLILAPNVVWEQNIAIQPEDATIREIEWSTNNEKVAVVDEKGVITAKGAGNCKITGTAKDGSKVKVAVSVQVKEHEIVILVPGEVNVGFETEEKETMAGIQVDNWFWGTIWKRTFKTQNQCVESPSNRVLIPVKAGSDTITITETENKRTTKKEKHTVFVARSAVGESSASAHAGGSDKIFFMNLPWGASFPEIQKQLSGQGKEAGALAQRNDYMRSQVDGEFPFANLMANHIALSFSYQEGENNPKANNRFFMGTFYFPEDTTVENLKQAAISVYGLDSGKASGEDWTWQKDHVSILLSKKKTYVSLELTWDGEK